MNAKFARGIVTEAEFKALLDDALLSAEFRAYLLRRFGGQGQRPKPTRCRAVKRHAPTLQFVLINLERQSDLNSEPPLRKLDG